MKKRNTSQVPVFMIAAGGLFIVMFIVLLITQNRQQQTAQSPGASDGLVQQNSGVIERVTLQDAKTALDTNAAIFVDVRSLDAFNGMHITGALSIPETEIQARLGELDPDQWIIPYCT